MTTGLPPTQFFSGIFYNPEFWSSGSFSLTQDVANTLYLEKTTPDTATALQTFSAGLSTQSMTAPSLTSDVTLFQSQTAGTIRIASSARSVHCSNIDCQGNAINNASAPANGALTIGSSQIAGTIDIGTNAGRTGVITIGANNNTINLGGHLTPTYATMPNSTTEVGMITSTTPSTGLALGTGLALIGPAVSIPAGVWLLQGNIQLPTATAGAVVNLTINTSATANPAATDSGVVQAAGASYLNVSLMISQASATSWGIYGSATAAATISNPRFIYTRIA